MVETEICCTPKTNEAFFQSKELHKHSKSMAFLPRFILQLSYTVIETQLRVKQELFNSILALEKKNGSETRFNDFIFIKTGMDTPDSMMSHFYGNGQPTFAPHASKKKKKIQNPIIFYYFVICSRIFNTAPSGLLGM